MAEDMEIRLNNLIKQIADVVRDHEMTDHAGNRCGDERANTVAFIAHKLMLSVDEWVVAMDRFGEYLQIHESHKHGH